MSFLPTNIIGPITMGGLAPTEKMLAAEVKSVVAAIDDALVVAGNDHMKLREALVQSRDSICQALGEKT